MLSAIGLIIAIALLIVMIVKGVDMITASVVTAAIILVTNVFGRSWLVLQFLVFDPCAGWHFW